MPRPRALVVASDPARLRTVCGDLARRGYDPLGFVSCADALGWLAEETPALAAVRALDCGEVLAELRDRSVPAESFARSGAVDARG